MIANLSLRIKNENKNLYKSISEISKLDVVNKVLSVIRVEDLS